MLLEACRLLFTLKPCGAPAPFCVPGHICSHCCMTRMYIGYESWWWYFYCWKLTTTYGYNICIPRPDEKHHVNHSTSIIIERSTSTVAYSLCQGIRVPRHEALQPLPVINFFIWKNLPRLQIILAAMLTKFPSPWCNSNGHKIPFVTVDLHILLCEWFVKLEPK